MYKWLPIVLPLFAAVALASPAMADSGKAKGKGNDHEQYQGGRHSGEPGGESMAGSLISAGITLAMARELAVNHQFTGQQSLPPGIRKNLARGKPLPPGIAKRSLPGPILAGLPHHDGYEWQQYGTDLVLVSAASALIADVLVDVFR